MPEFVRPYATAVTADRLCPGERLGSEFLRPYASAVTADRLRPIPLVISCESSSPFADVSSVHSPRFGDLGIDEAERLSPFVPRELPRFFATMATPTPGPGIGGLSHLIILDRSSQVHITRLHGMI